MLGRPITVFAAKPDTEKVTFSGMMDGKAMEGTVKNGNVQLTIEDKKIKFTGNQNLRGTAVIGQTDDASM